VGTPRFYNECKGVSGLRLIITLHAFTRIEIAHRGCGNTKNLLDVAHSIRLSHDFPFHKLNTSLFSLTSFSSSYTLSPCGVISALYIMFAMVPFGR
jgi:hypothetical protein